MAAATYTAVTGVGPCKAMQDAVVVLYGVFDAAEQGLASGESISVITIPAETLVKNVLIYIETPESVDYTFGVGDSASATQFLSAVTANANTTTTSAVGAAKYYSTANDIRITGHDDHAESVLKVHVWAFCILNAIG